MKHTSLQIIRDEHASLGAMLKSMRMLIKCGPADSPQRFFDCLRAMLFYIDEFPERLHHTKESTLLFPRVLEAAPGLQAAIAQLDSDHEQGEKAVRELQHLLLAWELMGDSRMQAFVTAGLRYLDFYQAHMHLEETLILPELRKSVFPKPTGNSWTLPSGKTWTHWGANTHPTRPTTGCSPASCYAPACRLGWVKRTASLDCTPAAVQDLRFTTRLRLASSGRAKVTRPLATLPITNMFWVIASLSLRLKGRSYVATTP
jgi:hemerythrin-like domain-containing protein